MSEIKPCPECTQGKHLNCTIEVLVGDELGPCPCREAGHEDRFMEAERARIDAANNAEWWAEA